MFHYFSDENLSEQNGTSATISILNWFLLYLLTFINLLPLIGTIIWLIVYISIGLRYDTAPSIRNYIKLQLIVSIIAIIFGVLLLIGCAGLIDAVTESLPSLTI